MKENILIDLSMQLSIEAIKFSDTIIGHISLRNQFERSATSVGANIHEANYANSKPDFISKLHDALKECYETEYWLKLFLKAGLTNEANSLSLFNLCGKIRRILIASINTAKK